MNNQSLFAKVRSVLILLVSLLAVSTVWAEAPSQETITYIGWNGEETLTEEFIVLAAASSSSVSSSSGAASSSSSMPEWYVVKGEVSYDCSDFNFAGQRVNLLLMDGAKLTVTNGDGRCAEFDNLVIYAQSLGDDMGRFEVPSLVVGNLNVVGGAISVSGAIVVNDVQLKGATVKASSYSVSGKISVDDNLLYGDELGNAYSGTLSAEQLAAMAGKTVAPAKNVKFWDGTSWSTKAWIPGVIPSDPPARIWKKFIGWYADGGYQTLFDFTDFKDGASIFAKWENLVEVSYLDANGKLQTLTEDYTVLIAASSLSSASSSSGAASSSSSVAPSSSSVSSSSNTTGVPFTPSTLWYVVSGDVSYSCEDFKFIGANVNLILMDGAKLTIQCNSNESSAEFGNLNIYAQSLGENMGKFEVPSLKTGPLSVYGGAISIGNAIEAAYFVEFKNGSVVAERVSAVSDVDSVTAEIKFAGATVRANSYSVSNRCEAKVGNNLLYGDEQGNAYNGTLSAEQLAAMAGKKVAPAKWLTFDYGESRSKKAWIPGVIPSEPTRIWKKFLGWYAEWWYQTLFDFTNFESGATVHAKWENLVEVTYIEFDGSLQTLTEDYTVLIAASSLSSPSSSGSAASSSSGVSSSGSASSSSNTAGVPFTPSDGWYVVSGEVSYNCSDFNFAGKFVRFILMDGAKLTVTNSGEECAEFVNLKVYAQSLGEKMGQFEVPSIITSNLMVFGGAVSTSGDIESNDDVILYNGSVSAGGAIEANIVEVLGEGSISTGGAIEANEVLLPKGSVVANGGIILHGNDDGGLIILGGATVWANSYTVPEGTLIDVDRNLVYMDEQGNVYNNLKAAQLESLAGQTLSPAKIVKFVDGSSLSEKALKIGEVPSNPTHIWKKFIGWYTDESYQTPFDFTNFESGATAYAKWENLVNVTYIDYDGSVKTLEDNYTVLIASSPSSSSSGAASSSSRISSSSGVAPSSSSISSSSSMTGWYVVSGEVSYSCEDFKFNGAEVNLILMDGAKLTIQCNSNESSAEFGGLNIYAQSLGENMGQFEVSSLKTDVLSVYGGSISIEGSIDADIVISSGLVYGDEQGNVYRGTLDAAQIALMAGKTLSLAKTITFVDGNSLSEKALKIGEVPSASTRYLGTFVGWYADKSYQTPFDFTNFESGAIAYAKWEDLVDVTYIDENGVTQTLTEDYTALVPTSSSSTPGAANSGSSMGVSFTPSDGWYVVSGKMYYNCSDFNFAGKNVNLILMDDASLAVNCNNSEGRAEFGNLTIYAQSLGKKMGGLSLALNVADKFVVNGGEIWADAIETSNAEFNKGSVYASGEIVIKKTDEDFAGIKGIKLAGATVMAYSYIIPGGDKYSIAVAPDLVYVNEQGNEYRGTLDADQITSIAHKNLYPAKMVKFVDGSSVSDKAVILGKIPCTPVANGQKFRWYADESRQELFDFTNFNSGAIAYGLWEDLTEVTYLDENGEEQSVTPDYELVGTECANSELFTNGGWVLVNSEVSYENGFAFTAENLHLILADDAKLTVKNKTSFNNLAIYAQSTGVNQGAFEVNADSYFAISVAALTIDGGVVKATGGINGIVGSSVKINDGVVKAFGKHAIYAYGDSLVVNGGTVEAHATGERPESGSGLSSLGNVDINGGTVTATGGYAINANGNVTIAGGKVNATSSIYYSEENCACFGIGSYKSYVYLKGGTVTALAENDCRGIYADNSMQKIIYLSGATVKASSYNDTIVVDMSYYDDLGNSYTGIIREEGRLELANKYVYPPALVITKNAEDKPVATLDGNFDKDMPIVITQETTVDEVVLNRGFTAGKRATVMFPFDVYADNLIGAESIDAFSYMETIKNDKGDIVKLVAHLNGVWDKPIETPAEVCDNTKSDCEATRVLLKANTPYMVQLEKGYSNLEIRGAVTLKTNKLEHAVRYGDWEFVGVYQYKKWTKDDAELQKGRAIYGFVGVAGDGFAVGDFVRLAAGAYINPMRAYLRYNPEPVVQNVLGLSKVARYNVADWNSASVTSELPKTIPVVRDSKDENGGEHTTVISDFNTRSGKFAVPRSANRVFDLKGRAYGKDARKARGAYYGKKVLK